MRRFSLLLTAFVMLSDAAHAGDHYLQGSVGQSYGFDIGSTHADIVGAANTLEDELWPAMAVHQGSVQATGDTRILHNMLQGPANVSGTGQAQAITTYPYGLQGIDVWNATASVGYRNNFWSLYYAGGFVGTHSTQMGTGVYPFETVGLMGLGFFESVVAPFSGERSLQLADPYYGSAAHYMVGAGGHYRGGSLRLAFLGNEQAGLMASVGYEPWNVSASMVIAAASGEVPYVRLGMIRSAAPWRALFGEEVGECLPDEHCIVPPLLSLYARGYLLSVPEPKIFAPSSAPQSTGLWTIHIEQLNIPFVLGYLDARLAFGVTPAWWLHDLSVGWHSPTFNGGNTLTTGLPPLDFGLVVGYAQMPTLAYAGNAGQGKFTFTLEARWGDWLKGGVRYNDPEALALYPFANSATEVFVSVTQEAFFHD